MAASRPRVILSAAASIDGRIAASPRDSRLSSPADLRRVHRLRGECDAIVVGRRTVETDDPMLTARPAPPARRPAAAARTPLRVVISARADVPASSQVVRTAPDVPTLVACCEAAPRRAVRALEARSVKVFAAGARSVDLRALLARLRRTGVRTVLLEGGGETNWRFVRLGLVDEIRLAVAPVVIGGGGGAAGAGRSVPLVGGAGFPTVAGAPRFRLASARRTRGTGEIVLTYAAGRRPAAPRAQ